LSENALIYPKRKIITKKKKKKKLQSDIDKYLNNIKLDESKMKVINSADQIEEKSDKSPVMFFSDSDSD